MKNYDNITLNWVILGSVGSLWSLNQRVLYKREKIKYISVYVQSWKHYQDYQDYQKGVKQ